MSSRTKVKGPIKREQDANTFSLRKWQQYFASIYSRQNRNVKRFAFSGNSVAFIRGYSIAHISQDLGNLAEQVREGNKNNLRRYIGSLFAWICALATEAGLDLQRITWRKYPGECPYCHKAKDCGDAWWSTDQMKKGKKTKPGKRRKTGEVPGNLDGWVDEWKKIYGSKIMVAIPLHDVMHKLYEELAELVDEFDKSPKSGLEGVKNELPDFLSWLFSLIIKLKQYGFLDNGDTVAKILFEKFQKGCNTCKKHVCTCRPEWVAWSK